MPPLENPTVLSRSPESCGCHLASERASSAAHKAYAMKGARDLESWRAQYCSFNPIHISKTGQDYLQAKTGAVQICNSRERAVLKKLHINLKKPPMCELLQTS